MKQTFTTKIDFGEYTIEEAIKIMQEKEPDKTIDKSYLEKMFADMFKEYLDGKINDDKNKILSVKCVIKD